MKLSGGGGPSEGKDEGQLAEAHTGRTAEAARIEELYLGFRDKFAGVSAGPAGAGRSPAVVRQPACCMRGGGLSRRVHAAAQVPEVTPAEVAQWLQVCRARTLAPGTDSRCCNRGLPARCRRRVCWWAMAAAECSQTPPWLDLRKDN